MDQRSVAPAWASKWIGGQSCGANNNLVFAGRFLPILQLRTGLESRIFAGTLTIVGPSPPITINNPYCADLNLSLDLSFVVDERDGSIESFLAHAAVPGSFASPVIAPSSPTSAKSTPLYDLILGGRAWKVPEGAACVPPAP